MCIFFFSPAHFGAAKGQLSELKLLAEHGGDLWMTNAKGDYPIHDAVNSRHVFCALARLIIKPF